MTHHPTKPDQPGHGEVVQEFRTVAQTDPPFAQQLTTKITPQEMPALGLKGVAAIVANFSAVVIITALFVYLMTYALPASQREFSNSIAREREAYQMDLRETRHLFSNELHYQHQNDIKAQNALLKTLNDLTLEIRRLGSKLDKPDPEPETSLFRLFGLERMPAPHEVIP